MLKMNKKGVGKMNVTEILQILDTQEEEMQPKVERVFKSVASTVNNPNWSKFTVQAQNEEKSKIVNTAIAELGSIRNEYIENCKELIKNSEITLSAPQIKDQYTLMSNKYKLIGKPLENQLEVLRNTTNQNDFDILKGIILERLTDQTQIREVEKIELLTTDKIKAQALGQLKFRTADVEYVPGLSLWRTVSIQSVGGLRNYLYSLIR